MWFWFFVLKVEEMAGKTACLRLRRGRAVRFPVAKLRFFHQTCFPQSWKIALCCVVFLSFGSCDAVAVVEMLRLRPRGWLLCCGMAPAFLRHRLAGASLRRPSRRCTKAFVAG